MAGVTRSRLLHMNVSEARLVIAVPPPHRRRLQVEVLCKAGDGTDDELS